MRERTILVLTIMLAVSCSSAAPPAKPAPEIKPERRAFDFLIGTWRIVQRETPTGVTAGGDDRYVFESSPYGHAVVGRWHFNRGTAAAPEIAEAFYMSAFDDRSASWSFYFVSDKSAQYYEGRQEEGRWRFYKRFPDFLQRQEWIAKDGQTMIRTIENSTDGGATWSRTMTATLARLPTTPGPP